MNMQIQNLTIDGLYGYINKQIDFNSDMTLLVGINGSGKTSILNIINWILKPSIPMLCVTEFKTIRLKIKFKDTHYEIICTHNKATFKYQIKTEKEKYQSLMVRISTPPSEIKNDEILKANLIQNYTFLVPNPKEKKTMDLISSFPNPTIIGLDRNLYAEEKEQIFIEENVRIKNAKRNTNTNLSPLDRVKEIVNKEYRKRKNEILNLTNDLKNHLMLSTFDGSVTKSALLLSEPKTRLDLNTIQNVEQRVEDYFNKFEKNVFNEKAKTTIRNYFTQLKDITTSYQTKSGNDIDKLIYSLNANQFTKLNLLLAKFEKFEENSKRTLESISKFLETLNFFLIDSYKEILFKEDTSELVFNVLDKNKKITSQFKDIKFLSSGEQQILILFSYIAFNSQDGRLFIIDEPELSLHIKWQEDFLEKIENITPKSTQLIFATHSPILANKRKNKAVALLSYNK